MAIYRKINTTFWSDPFICDLPADKKLFYLYLLTNERTKQCGIYDISKRQISFDLGISVKEVTTEINFFQSKGKLRFSDDTNEIALKNWARFNGSTSPKVVKCVESELKLVKNRVLIDYIYSIDTLSQETQAPTEEETPTETPTPEEEQKENNSKKELLVVGETPPETQKRFSFKNALIEYGFNSDLVSDWLAVRKTKKLTNTQTAFNQFISEIESRPCDINKTLEICVSNSWGGFKHNWVDNLNKDLHGKPKPTSEKSNSEIFTDGMQSGWAKDIRFKL